MSDSALAPIFSYVGWAFLPSYATSILQSVFYKITIRAGQPHPQPGTPLFAKHHRRIRIFVLCLYLLYTLVQSLYDIKIAGDFYTILAVSPSSADRQVRTKFRRLAAKYHPDKLASNPDINGLNGQNEQDAHFLSLRLAQDTLLSAHTRYAYNHFGPGVTTIQMPHLKTISSYVYVGLRSKIPEYTTSVLSLIVLNYIWLPKWGQFWRYLIVAATAVLELYLLTHDFHSPAYITSISNFVQQSTPLRDLLPPHLLPYQILAITRQFSISLNIFISQLAPPSHMKDQASQSSHFLSQLNNALSHISQTASRTDAEAMSMLKLQLSPFQGDQIKSKALRQGMSEGMITASVRNHPEVKEAVARALDKRKAEARSVESMDGAAVVGLLGSDTNFS